jgi:hypothetical protein
LETYASANGTAAGRASLATVNNQTITVYSFSARKQPTYLSLPSGYTLESGDGRFDNSIAISRDGQYLTLILVPRNDFNQRATSPDDKVIVWNVATGLSMDLTSQLGSPSVRHQPIDVRFAPDGHDILVDYVDGTIARVHPNPGGWEVSDVLRASSTVERFGLETEPGGIYLIEVRRQTGSATSDDRVLRFSYAGTLLNAWDFTTLRINSPSIVPLSDDGVLLIDDGGTAYRLRLDGSMGKPVDISGSTARDIVEARQVPGTQHVLISNFGVVETYDLTHDILLSGDTLDSSLGLFLNFAITTDGRYLLGSGVGYNQMDIDALAPEDRLASLCDTAGGSGMNRQQWAAYVGNAAPYTDPCAQNRTSLSAFYNLARQGEFSSPPHLVQTPSTAAAASFRASCANPAQAGYSAYGDFAWGDAGGTEVICSKGTLKWIVPDPGDDTFQAGKVAGQDVFIVTGKITPEAYSMANTAIDMLLPDAAARSTTVTNGTASITSSGVEVTGTMGAIQVRSTFGFDQHGYWNIQGEVPVGRA